MNESSHDFWSCIVWSLFVEFNDLSSLFLQETLFILFYFLFHHPNVSFTSYHITRIRDDAREDPATTILSYSLLKSKTKPMERSTQSFKNSLFSLSMVRTRTQHLISLTLHQIGRQNITCWHKKMRAAAKRERREKHRLVCDSLLCVVEIKLCCEVVESSNKVWALPLISLFYTLSCLSFSERTSTRSSFLTKDVEWKSHQG